LLEVIKGRIESRSANIVSVFHFVHSFIR